MAHLQVNGAAQTITDTNGNELLKFAETASAVNEVTLTNAATGQTAKVSATGGDTDIGLELIPKGAGAVKATGPLNVTGALDHDGSTVGFFGVAPTVRPSAYTPTNVVTDRAYDANATTVDEVADVLGTLIADLKTLGILQ